MGIREMVNARRARKETLTNPRPIHDKVAKLTLAGGDATVLTA